MVAGDFNSVTRAEEVPNEGKLDKRRCVGFLDLIYDLELIDLGFTGPCFTWGKGDVYEYFPWSNSDWRFLFEQDMVTHLPKLNSDHSPLLIKP